MSYILRERHCNFYCAKTTKMLQARLCKYIYYIFGFIGLQCFPAAFALLLNAVLYSYWSQLFTTRHT